MRFRPIPSSGQSPSHERQWAQGSRVGSLATRSVPPSAFARFRNCPRMGSSNEKDIRSSSNSRDHEQSRTSLSGRPQRGEDFCYAPRGECALEGAGPWLAADPLLLRPRRLGMIGFSSPRRRPMTKTRRRAPSREGRRGRFGCEPMPASTTHRGLCPCPARGALDWTWIKNIPAEPLTAGGPVPSLLLSRRIIGIEEQDA